MRRMRNVSKEGCIYPVVVCKWYQFLPRCEKCGWIMPFKEAMKIGTKESDYDEKDGTGGLSRKIRSTKAGL